MSQNSSHPILKTLWLDTAPDTHFAPQSKDFSVDVLVIGGGISGITAAYLLQDAGKNVALVDKDQVGKGESGHTTAHLSLALDWRYHELVGKFGEEDCQDIILSHQMAIDNIERLTRTVGVDTKFKRLPGYLFAENTEGLEDIEKEAMATMDLGLKTTLLRNAKRGRITDLPFAVDAALRFDNQAQFHPRLYMLALLEAFQKMGGKVLEYTQVTNIEDGEPCMVTTNRGSIKAEDVLVLTNNPISTRVALHTKIASYRTYAIAFRHPRLDGLFWDTSDPYHYIRSENIAGTDFLIVGGEDHKTGQVTDTFHCFSRLEEYARRRFGLLGESNYHWSGQVVEPVDGLPYIGRNPGADHVYVATGFSGNGMTYGTLSAMMMKDFVLELENPFEDLYSPSRISPLAGAKEFIKENANVGVCMVKDWLDYRRDTHRQLDPAELAEGEGGVFDFEGKKVAAFKDETGRMHMSSTVCPHLGCHVHWNQAEQSFDCPCHGSRFAGTGQVLNGPAKSGLEKFEFPEVKEEKEERIVKPTLDPHLEGA